MDHSRDTDCAGLGQRLDAGRDVHALTVDILAIIDNIAKMDAHTKIEWAFAHVVLNGHGAIDGILDAGKLGKKTVASKLNDAAGVFGNARFNGLVASSLPGSSRCLSISLDESRIPRDIRCDYSRQPPTPFGFVHDFLP